jgi:hypothetical protein
MSTNLKKLATTVAAAAAVAAPAALFVGAGTAQAATPPSVTYSNNAFGTIAHISDPANPAGSIEICHYSSHVKGNPFLFPFYSPVQVSGSTASDLQIFGLQTGTAYTVKVECNGGGSTTFTQNF